MTTAGLRLLADVCRPFRDPPTVGERAVPDRIDDGDLNGVAAAVARDPDLPPGRGRGDLGRGAEPVALQPGRPRLLVRGGAGAYSAALAGSRVVTVLRSTSSAVPW